MDGDNIKRKYLKGEDGYKIFSVRIKEETVKELDKLANKINRSRNAIINIFINYGVENSEIIK